MKASQGSTTGHRSPLLAVVTIPPLPIDNGFTLRVANMLRELGAYWSITLVAPALPRGRSYPSIPGVDRLVTVPMVGRMTYLPSQYDVAPLRYRVDELIREIRPAALLLWGGAEFLAFDRPDRPHTVADRIDCATLTAWRQARMAPTLRTKLSELSEVITYASYERKIDRSADTVVVVGEADAAVMRRIGGRSNVHVVSNGVSLPEESATFGAEAAEPTVTFTGVLNYPPNMDAVLFFAREVLPLIRAEEPTAVFLVAGRSPAEEIRALEGTPGLRILADVADMRAVIAESWIAVAPMQSGSGVKNKILEAWAMAKPVVMTGLAANGLELTPHVRTLVADRPRELAALVVGLIRDQPRRAALGLSGREIVTLRHSWLGAGRMMDTLLRTNAESVARGKG